LIQIPPTGDLYVAPVGMLFLGHLSYKKKSEKKNQKFVNYSKCEISEFKTENVQEVKMDQIRYFRATIRRCNRTMVAAPDPSTPYKRGWLAAY
jgi:hypothetical protein